MKKIIALLLALMFALSFAACGSESPVEEAPAPTAAPKETAAPATAAPVEVVAAPEESVEAQEETSSPNIADPAEEGLIVALSLVEHPVEELYEALGEPIESMYASSCLVQGGQDGVLTYDGFTVYTLVDANGNETVYDAE